MTNQVEVWAARPARLRLDGAWTMLSPEERGRLARFVSTTAQRSYLAAHAMIRLLAADWLGVTPDEIRLEQRCGSCGRHGHGVPRILDRDVHVSLSRRPDLVAVAIGSGPVGVDVEPEGATGWRAVQTVALSPEERHHCAGEGEFLVRWTMKECLVKLGLLSLDRFSSTTLRLDADERTARLCTASLSARRMAGHVVAVGSTVTQDHRVSLLTGTGAAGGSAPASLRSPA